jgi:hypothetical protein
MMNYMWKEMVVAYFKVEFSRGPVTGFCENGNEPSGHIRGGEFVD